MLQCIQHNKKNLILIDAKKSNDCIFVNCNFRGTMSWWDSASALKTAQKRIDKVLDIKEDEEQQGENNF